MAKNLKTAPLKEDSKDKINGENDAGIPDAAKLPPPPKGDNDEDSDDSVSTEEPGEDLILEGVLVRNPEVSSSSDDDDDDEEDSDDEGDDVDKKPSPSATTQQVSDNRGKDGVKESESKNNDSKDTKSENEKKRPASDTAAAPHQQSQQKQPKKSKKKKKNKSGEIEMVQVDFIFCDMDEKFFHGMKMLLHSSSPVYQPQSSNLSDLMIENVAVGTVCGTEGDTDGNVYGFASVLNMTTYKEQPCIQYLKKMCLDNCPDARKSEIETVLSGKTARPAGFLLHGRMVNLPLEIVLVLHQQLVLDMDWAVEHAEGGEAERKSLDFGVFVRMAPATKDGGTVVYRYFDDEVFATNAEFVYNISAPKSYGSEEQQMCSIIVMTKTGHRTAMKELTQMIGGSGGA